VVLVRARVYGLVLNFLANGVLLYGAATYLDDGSNLYLLLGGALTTAGCILWLARPT
jgi:hypothetical protein